MDYIAMQAIEVYVNEQLFDRIF